MKLITKAKVSDAIRIHELINSFADKGIMLPRSLSEIYENIRDYFVFRESKQVIACAALHISWADMAELRSVAVAESNQGQGIGDRLMEACLNEARELGISTVFCLTYQPVFFERFGFTQLDKMELPQKVWSECFRCPKFPNCDEIALICHLKVSKE
ncbi:MAG: N-acetyltransferase [Dehalococcoidales bacterium]|nr:N-acetyltransferase [Dehalococcoidales bacterium]